jgi:hypothetical protein
MGPKVILQGNNLQRRMSALGQKQTSANVWMMSALPPKADMAQHDPDVRFVGWALRSLDVGHRPH